MDRERPERLPSAADLPQRPRATSVPRVRTEEVRGAAIGCQKLRSELPQRPRTTSPPRIRVERMIGWFRTASPRPGPPGAAATRRSTAQPSTRLPISVCSQTYPSLARIRPYLRAPAAADNADMTVADAPDAEQRQRLTYIDQQQGPGGHVHMITADRPSCPVGPVPGQLSPGQEPTEPAQQLGQDIRAVLGSLTRHISKLESDNDRLRRDNDRLRAQAKRLRSQVQAIGTQVARQVSEVLASTGD
jgi:hypothetical protein